MSAPSPYTVELPAGGTVVLQNAEEVEHWNTTAQGYISDYGINKVNDRVLLGAILAQALVLYRSQQELTDPNKAKGAHTLIAKTAEEIRELEKALGIDKKTRDQGGQHNVADYITRLKRAAHEKGVRISDRVKAFEHLAMEAKWKIRLLRNGDDEDRAYHGISEKSIIDWLETELETIEQADKDWAKTKGKIFVGRL